MSLADKFLRWYHRYFTEITWFLIGNLAVQIVDAFEKHDYIEVLWCSAFLYLNFAIWKRNQ
jgi:hypothetical protein